jgi:hypothetical protein
MSSQIDKAKNTLRAAESALKREQLLHDLRVVFGSPAGQRIMLFMMTESGVGESVFTGNSKTYHKAGAQDFCNDLIDLLREADLEVYISIIRLQEQIRQEIRDTQGDSHDGGTDAGNE